MSTITPDKPATEEKAPEAATRPARSFATLGWAMLGSALVWAALPPLDLWLLAWVAPIPWLILITQTKLPGRHPYRDVWLAGVAFWLAAVYWICYPHPATCVGWVLMSGYLGVYLPLFVGLTRHVVHRWNVSIVLAAPVVYTGLELVRAHALSGFLMAALGHTQHRWLSLIQVSDIAGGYAVTFLVMLVAACLVRMFISSKRSRRITSRSPLAPPRRGQGEEKPEAILRPVVTWWPTVPMLLVPALAVAYGSFRTSGEHTEPGPRVALIQGTIEPDWDADDDRQRRMIEAYLSLSVEAIKASDGKLDLIVWPETMYRGGLYSHDEGATSPAWTKLPPEEIIRRSESRLADLAEYLGSRSALMLGTDAHHLGTSRRQRFNSAVLVAPEGEVLDRYDKIHLVMFGEYIPLGKAFPSLYQYSPMSGTDSGEEPVALQVPGGAVYAPNICFESVVPHLIRRIVLELHEAGREPDVLVNLTNDAWFRGSSELDMHLRCGVFRAIECRKPFIVAANGGISASIDGDGRILAALPRQEKGHLIADVQLDRRGSFYLRWGDWFAGLCFLFALAAAVHGVFDRFKKRHSE